MTAAGSNVVLTGFMGTGKSVVGRALAERLGRTFIDTDALIEAEHGPVPTLFADHGEAHFRQLEADLAERLAAQSGLVIATGGGMLLHGDVAAVLAATGRIFRLTASAETILARVRADGVSGRPLLDTDDPEARVAALLAEREQHYARFETVTTDDRDVDEIVDDLARRLGD